MDSETRRRLREAVSEVQRRRARKNHRAAQELAKKYGFSGPVMRDPIGHKPK